MSRLIEESQIVQLFVPSDLAVGATNSDWVGLQEHDHVAILISKAAGAAGEIPTFTLRQASDNAGTGAKALNFTRVEHKTNADITTVNQFTKVAQAAGNTYVPAAGNTQALIVIEFDAMELDIANGFKYVQVQINDVGVTAQLASALAVLTQPRYAQQAGISAID